MNVERPTKPCNAAGYDLPAPQQRPQTAPPGGADHQLRRVLVARELPQGVGHAYPDHLMPAPTEGLRQRAVASQRGGIRPRASIAASDVDGHQVAARGPSGQPSGPADQPIAFGAAGNTNNDPFACLPGRCDPVLGPMLQRLVNSVSQPQHGQLAQPGQVSEPEIVRQGRGYPI